MQKLYCYVDEAGQDDASRFFVVVALASDTDQDTLRRQLANVEKQAQTHGLKWHKSRHERRMRYLSLVLDRKIAFDEVYVGRYAKPIPYFFPVIDVIEKAVKRAAKGRYRAVIYVDGINKTIAKALTNALRTRGISLRMVKSRKDENEILIRFVDMWAGCVRSALLSEKESVEVLNQAQRSGYLQEVTTENPRTEVRGFYEFLG